MYLDFESGIRGGLSQVSTRYAKANNNYSKNYNKNAEDSYIMYYNANNLYGGAMSSHLPTKDFKYNNEQWTEEKILELKDDDDKGY